MTTSAVKRIDVSPSKIKTFLNCPALYKSRYLTKWSEKPREPNSPVQDAGTFVHKVLELAGRDYIAKRRQEPVTLEYLLDILEWVLRAMPEESWKAQTQLRADTIRLAVEVLAKCWNKVDFTYTVQVEQKWEIDLGPLDPLEPETHVFAVGVFDRVDQLPDGSIVVVDYKAGFDVMTRTEAELDPQGNLYVLAARDKFSQGGDVDVGFELHYLSRNVRIGPIRWDPFRDSWMRRLITAAQYRITKATGFPETPGLPHCVYCPLQGRCESYKKMLSGPLRVVGSSLDENARDYDRLRALLKLAGDLKDRNGERLQEAVRQSKGGALYMSGFRAELTFTPRLDYKDFARTVSAAAKAVYEAAKIAKEAEDRRARDAAEAAAADTGSQAPGATQQDPAKALEVAEARIVELTETVRKQQAWIEVASRIGKAQKGQIDDFVTSLPAEVADMVMAEIAPTSDDAGYYYLTLSELDNPFMLSADVKDPPPQDVARATVENPFAKDPAPIAQAASA